MSRSGARRGMIGMVEVLARPLRKKTVQSKGLGDNMIGGSVNRDNPPPPRGETATALCGRAPNTAFCAVLTRFPPAIARPSLTRGVAEEGRCSVGFRTNSNSVAEAAELGPMRGDGAALGRRMGASGVSVVVDDNNDTAVFGWDSCKKF